MRARIHFIIFSISFFVVYSPIQVFGQNKYKLLVLGDYTLYSEEWAGTDVEVNGLLGGTLEIGQLLKDKNLLLSLGGGFGYGTDSGNWNVIGDPMEAKITNFNLALQSRYVFGLKDKKNFLPFVGVGFKYINEKTKLNGTTSVGGSGISLSYSPSETESSIKFIVSGGFLYSNFIVQMDIISPGVISIGYLF